MCVQEEERVKGSHGDSLNYLKGKSKEAILQQETFRSFLFSVQGQTTSE